MRVRLVVGILAVVIGVITTPAAAGAACSEVVESGDLVFVGTAVATSEHGRFARFAVEEIWTGDASLAPGGRVTIVGGPQWPFSPESGRFVAIEHEHVYEPGQRYLVVATDDRFWANVGMTETVYPPGALTDGACTISAPWDDSLARYRPASVTTIEHDEPLGPEPWSDDSPPYLLIVVTTVLVGGGCLYLLFRRGSLAHRAREEQGPA